MSNFCRLAADASTASALSALLTASRIGVAEKSEALTSCCRRWRCSLVAETRNDSTSCRRKVNIADCDVGNKQSDRIRATAE